MRRKPKVKNEQAGAALEKRESAELSDRILEKISNGLTNCTNSAEEKMGTISTIGSKLNRR